uniref:Fimbrial protein n=1 Tax=Strongyloides venezuelensis TaxID=75913 RepID=A0A0K0G5V0_STRVS
MTNKSYWYSLTWTILGLVACLGLFSRFHNPCGVHKTLFSDVVYSTLTKTGDKGATFFTLKISFSTCVSGNKDEISESAN